MRTVYSKVTWEKHNFNTNVFLLVKEPEPMADTVEPKLEKKRVSINYQYFQDMRRVLDGLLLTDGVSHRWFHGEYFLEGEECLQRDFIRGNRIGEPERTSFSDNGVPVSQPADVPPTSKHNFSVKKCISITASRS